MTRIEWRLLAIQYAKSEGIPVSQLVKCETEDSIDLSWHFFLASSHRRNVLIDCGTDEFHLRPNGARAQRWKIQPSAGVLSAFSATGLSPGDITDVVLTHAHWDHCDGVHHFTNAVVHMNCFEWAQLLAYADQEQLLRLKELSSAGRLSLFSEDVRILADGLQLQEAGKHTQHHLVARVATAGGDYVIAGDAAYLYRNIELACPITCTAEPDRNVEDLKALRASVPHGHVIPGHDPELFDRFHSEANIAIISG